MPDSMEQPERLLKRRLRGPRPEEPGNADNKRARLRERARIIGEERKDRHIEMLETYLAREKDARMIERFIWIVVTVIVLDLHFFTQMPSPAAYLIVVLEITLLTFISKWLGVGAVLRVILLSRILRFFQKDLGA